MEENLSRKITRLLQNTRARKKVVEEEFPQINLSSDEKLLSFQGDDLVKKERDALERIVGYYTDKTAEEFFREDPEQYIEIRREHVRSLAIRNLSMDKSRDEMETLPSDIFKFEYLEEIELFRNGLRRLEIKKNMENIRSADFQTNGIHTIKGLEKWPNMKYMNLYANSVNSLEELKEVPELEKVDLRENVGLFDDRENRLTVMYLEDRGVEVLHDDFSEDTDYGFLKKIEDEFAYAVKEGKEYDMFDKDGRQT